MRSAVKDYFYDLWLLTFSFIKQLTVLFSTDKVSSSSDISISVTAKSSPVLIHIFASLAFWFASTVFNDEMDSFNCKELELSGSNGGAGGGEETSHLNWPFDKERQAGDEGSSDTTGGKLGQLNTSEYIEKFEFFLWSTSFFTILSCRMIKIY